MLPPLKFLLEAVAYGVLVPAAVAMAVLILARRWGERHGGEAPRGGAGLAAGAGLLAGFVALAGSRQLGWEFLAPTDSWHWLPLLSVLATGVGIAERVTSWTPVARGGLRLLVAAATAWLLVRAESAVQAVNPGWLAGVGLAVLVSWGLLDPLARRWPGPGLPALLASVALAAGAVLALSGILKFAQMAGVLAAVLAGCAGPARWPPGESPARGAVPGLSVLLPGLLFAGYFNTFSDVPPASFLLVLAAPLGPGVAALLPSSKSAGRWGKALSAGVTLSLLGLAVTLAALA
jgi:hypothetical protein